MAITNFFPLEYNIKYKIIFITNEAQIKFKMTAGGLYRHWLRGCYILGPVYITICIKKKQILVNSFILFLSR